MRNSSEKFEILRGTLVSRMDIHTKPGQCPLKKKWKPSWTYIKRRWRPQYTQSGPSYRRPSNVGW
jgi:hypothetical protein